MVQLNVENHNAGLIKPENLLITNGCKKKQRTINTLLSIILKSLQDYPLYVKKTMIVNKTDILKNNEEFEVINLDD